MKRFLTIIVVLFAFHGIMSAQCEPGLASYADVRTMAVVLLEHNNFEFTGVLVNNEDEDGKFYILTTSYPFLYCDIIDGTSSGSSNDTYISDILISWSTSTTGFLNEYGATVVFNGESSSLGSTSVALLELDDAPPYEEIPYLGVNFGDDGEDCIAMHYLSNAGIQKRDLHVKSKSSGFAALDCEDETLLTYNFTNSSNGVRVTEWGGLYFQGSEYAKGNLNQNDDSKGAPLINKENQVTSLYVTKPDGSSCNKDNAYFTKQYPPEIQDILGTNVRAIKIGPCVSEEIVELVPITSNLTDNAIVRVIGKSKISASAVVTFNAGTEVILENGFESGNEFIAEIKSCVSQITPLAKTTRENESIAENKVEEKIVSFNKDVNAYPTVLIENQIQLEIEGLNFVQFYLTDMQGKVLLKDSYSIENNKSLTKINLPNLSSGFYLLYVNDGQYSKTIKLIKE